ncbi:MAG TPA: FliM/FliN family flagellar motor switch protein [Kofleriaceae bacterium]|jgi:hypothetical protein
MRAPNFSPFPFDALRKVTRAEAAVESLAARWLAPRAAAATLIAPAPLDPNAALTEVRVDEHRVFVAAPSAWVRDQAQRMLGGPPELAAARPLNVVENAILALLVAEALQQAGMRGDVWPIVDQSEARRAFDTVAAKVSLSIRGIPVVIAIPDSMRLANPPASWPTWQFDLPITVGACVLHRDDVARLRIRDVVTVERRLALRVGPGEIQLEAKPGAVEAKVAIGYVPRPVVTADDAQLELTVQLGTTRLTLRQLAELAPGAIVSLGRPLSGPYEVRAQGRLIGQGELVDVDGELGVRIVTLQE